jgi:vacuolar-type H+-ATPase subunit E/Vma4
MRTLGSAVSVVEAVREEAEREVERIRRESDEAVRRLEADARIADATPLDRDARLAAARREVSASLAAEDAADRRAALEEREAWAMRAIDAGRRRLADDRDAVSRRELLLALAIEAAATIPFEEVEVGVAPWDARFVDAAFLDEVARRSGKRSAKRSGNQDDLPESGCVVSSPGGKVRSDNSLPARARRFEGAWRRALTEIYGR